MNCVAAASKAAGRGGNRNRMPTDDVTAVLACRLHDGSAGCGDCDNLRSWAVQGAPECGDGLWLPGILQPAMAADTLTGRANLAHETGMAGDAAGARDQYAVLLPLCEQRLGPDHPYALLARANLAHWTGMAGDAAGARDQLAVLLAIEERALGAGHVYALLARANLAHWTGMAGDAAEARDQYAVLLAIEQRELGRDHPYAELARASLDYWTAAADASRK
jgi:hypothetical protein